MPVSQILKQPNEEKWRTIVLTNMLIKPIASKNKQAVETFLEQVGFTKTTTDTFKFIEKEEEK